MRQYIVSTFREDLDFDDNFYNLLNERLLLKLEHDINSTLISGIHKNIIKHSLLIPSCLNARKQVRRIMKEYFQKQYLDIANIDAYFISERELVLKHGLWLNVGRKQAIENGDFTFNPKTNRFNIII